MKKLLFLCLFSTQLYATDLIYKSSFEANALVAGTASGVLNTGLTLELSVNNQTELLSIDDNGGFVFATNVGFGSHWAVTIINLPNIPQQQSCEVSNNEGVISPGGASTLQVICDDTSWNWNQMNWNNGGWQ
ncbi:hypothetical protein [Marinicella rhabdoformis]|uniref:hypothetical protein n=1 Tax=Marinicella rhabdoformis TaxID=2580566 RepID=UPI0012AEC21D|nr:hypothetical protein [Marinicella rhabdoformis]